jgi:hypothetical protein
VVDQKSADDQATEWHDLKPRAEHGHVVQLEWWRLILAVDDNQSQIATWM